MCSDFLFWVQLSSFLDHWLGWFVAVSSVPSAFVRQNSSPFGSDSLTMHLLASHPICGLLWLFFKLNPSDRTGAGRDSAAMPADLQQLPFEGSNKCLRWSHNPLTQYCDMRALSLAESIKGRGNLNSARCPLHYAKLWHVCIAKCKAKGSTSRQLILYARVILNLCCSRIMQNGSQGLSQPAKKNPKPKLKKGCWSKMCFVFSSASLEKQM